MEKSGPQKKRVLILGAGFGGLRLYNNLRKEYDVLLLDRKSFFEFAPDIPSTFVTASKHSHIIIDLEKHCTEKTFLQGSLVSAGPEKVKMLPFNYERAVELLDSKDWPYIADKPAAGEMLSEGQESQKTLDLKFDYCVIAIGAMYPGPIGTTASHINDRKKEIQEVADKLTSGNYTGISVVGGGYVGVETACYAHKVIKEKKFDLPVKIYNRGPIICKNVNEKAREYILKDLQKKGIQLLVNQAVTPEQCSTKGDLVFDCRGTAQSHNRPYFEHSFAIGPDSCLVGNNYMQVQKNDLSYCANVFSIGDCVTVTKNPPKLGFIAMGQADFLYDLFGTLGKKEKNGELGPTAGQNKVQAEQPVPSPDFQKLKIKDYSKVKEPQVLTMRLGDEVIMVTKDKVKTGCGLSTMRDSAYKDSLSALKDSTWGKFKSSMSHFFGNLLYGG